MWNTNSFRTNVDLGTPVASLYRNVMDEIHVLLVDHEQDLVNTINMLQLCQYRVTAEYFASAATERVASVQSKFDVIMANVNDAHVCALVQQALEMGIPIVLVSSHDDASTAMKSIDMGAFLYLVKPLPLELMRSLWQHVLREKGRMMREREKMLMVTSNYAAVPNVDDMIHTPIAGNNLMLMGRVSEKNNVRGVVRKGEAPDGYYMPEGTPMRIGTSKVKRKVCTEWTPELHAKFMDAIHQLGEGKCFPKEIRELMNVPGISRMQVASHLQAFRQKCRNDNWRSPEPKKSAGQGSVSASTHNEGSSRRRARRFGSMPQMVKGPSSLGHEVASRAETSEAPTSINAGFENTVKHGNLKNNGGGAALHQQCVTILPHTVTGTSSINHRQEEEVFSDIDHLVCGFSDLLQGSSVGHEDAVPALSCYPYHNIYSD